MDKHLIRRNNTQIIMFALYNLRDEGLIMQKDVAEITKSIHDALLYKTRSG